MARKQSATPLPPPPPPSSAPDLYYCYVTRRHGAPPRRAGIVWPDGQEQGATLSARDIAIIRADPGYTIEHIVAVEDAA